MRNCIFVLSIDTEEEWDWNGPFPGDSVSVKNVNEIPSFHAAISEMGVRPTYFLDYAVIENQHSCNLLRHLVSTQDNLEFGAHLHPWVTPPKTKILNEADSHIVNLPIGMVRQQIETLTTSIQDTFKVQPNAFRSGRWGINDPILSCLVEFGYTVDSSIYPYYKNEWFSCEDDNSLPKWLYPNPANTDERIFEIPVTAGFNQKNFSAMNEFQKKFEGNPWRYIRMIGMLWKLNVLRKIYLSPELSTTTDMIQLCKMALANQYPVIHMYLHSSSLLPQGSGYVRSSEDKTQMLEKIQDVINYLRGQCNLTFCTASEAAELLKGMQKGRDND